MLIRNYLRFTAISAIFISAILFHATATFAQHPCDNFPVTTCVVPSSLETWTVSDNNSIATSQAGEPSPWVPKSLWISWIAPKTRVYVADYRGTNPGNVTVNDAFLTIYKGGTTFASLTQVAQADSWTAPCTFYLSTIRGTESVDSPCLFIYAVAGTKYYFQSDQYNGTFSPSAGPYLLNVKPFASVTAANVSIGGRVTNDYGRGVSRTTVTLTDSNGNTRTANTNQFGYYRFTEVESGQNYILEAQRKGYQFENNPRVLNVNEDLTGEDFIGANPFIQRE
jgi:Carboxypeptidase regulatory-like domain